MTRKYHLMFYRRFHAGTAVCTGGWNYEFANSNVNMLRILFYFFIYKNYWYSYNFDPVGNTQLNKTTKNKS
jgi:hypothetical protein